MKIYLRGNPRTYGETALKTGLNKVDNAAFTALSAVPEFREAVKSGLVRLPEGIDLPATTADAPTETQSQRKARERAERDPAPAAEAPKTEDAPAA